MSKITVKDPFEVENVRAQMANKKDYLKLQSLYTESFPEIQDFNTSKLWDHLNIDGRLLIHKNPMENDRISNVASLINGEHISVLNIGFGSANLENKYFKKNKNVTWSGIDISQKSVKRASKLYPNASFKIGDIKNVKQKKNTFDYVIALEVLEHIRPSQIFQALSEMYRVTKPGKHLIISVPLNEGLEQMISKGENPNAHVRIYTPDLIKAELTIAGFTVLKEQTLFAFHTFYRLKTIIARSVYTKKCNPNNIIILAKKP